MLYRVKQVADMADISVRTLHHYDAVGILKPSASTGSGYRLYGPQDLERLQQILFFRELGFSLKDIGQILDSPDFDRCQALVLHRDLLRQQQQRITGLLELVDNTIANMERGIEMSDHEMFEAFSRERMEEYKREARELFDPALVSESEKRTAGYTDRQWQNIQDEQGLIYNSLGALMDRAADDPDVETLIERHHTSIDRDFYPCSLEVYEGLGALYTSDSRFMEYFDRIKPGLAEFITMAIISYCAKRRKDDDLKD